MKEWRGRVTDQLISAANSAWGSKADMLDKKERVHRARIARAIGRVVAMLVRDEMNLLEKAIGKFEKKKGGE